MTRVRISTTVDADALQAARMRLGRRDSEVLDEALGALLDALDAEDDAAALARAPYEDGVELVFPPGSVDDECFPERDGPADVVELAQHRRARRARPARPPRPEP
jgi:hypothetical protein